MDLTCQICSESYTASGIRCRRVLPCGHALCGVCTTRLFVNGQIFCPVCKQYCKYQDLDKTSINHELENVTKRLSSESLSSIGSTSAGPKLHYGMCEEHGSYKVHHCLTHDMFICSDCAVGYHLEGDCRRIPIEKYLDNKKAGLSMDLDSRLSSLQETNSQLEGHINVFKDSELHIKAQIEQLQSTILELNQKMSICQNNTSKYSGLIAECDERQRQFQVSKSKVESITNFMELNNETQWVESSRHKMQDWTEGVKHMIKQGFGSILTSGTFTSLVTSQETYATYIHDYQQRWGRIFSKDDNLLMQDLRRDNPPSGATIINLNDVTEYISTPRHVYLSFVSIKGTPLGTVIIRLNEQAPMHVQQSIDLFLGKTGARYSGSTALRMYDKGNPNERIILENYLNINNENSNQKLVPYLENGERIKHKQGLVVIQDEDCAGFRIITGKSFKGTWPGPPIGEVVLGMPILEKMIRDNLLVEMDWKNRKSEVIVSETGLIITSNFI